MSDPSVAADAPMPEFTIKARDALAYPIVKGYADLCSQFGLWRQEQEARKAAEEIREWQHANIDATKLPDHDHVPVLPPSEAK
jgi:hypothetical protein